ncbi:MAG: 23S rRNA (adenine(2503)-C(2))-methyltransferase [Candidatus Buchananbacteria bacterium RBG_13_36_9]|uniref:Probable dual-specificity RNA methyltransferase RlmN n=1 Tax=Candidatus Buchananbacteria bacterium RBG_13_36_9 TaxID=1797530 RepID=A0A1G1XQI3_9BACT|nr:MAG: 23S rRNA (adenine(2503)-C(2))-methyltransferase [Candidatus Buchananbacteria bacterium RBG_13_36_9]
MELEKLNKILKSEPTYRLKQVYAAIFQDLIDDWQKASNLPLALRGKLNQEFPLEIKAKIFETKAKESQKALLTLSDNAKIETVLLKHEDGRNTVCVSSQVGCPLGCLFCATGKMGFERNLNSWEIISQVLFFARQLKKTGERVSNLVFMGMGEPFLNYDNVLAAIKILNDKDGLNIGARHISISTVGITEGIKKLASEPLQINLAISLHAPNNELRSEIIPYNEQYPIKSILKIVDFYLKKTNRQVMFEYLMIKDYNDSEEQAEELVEILKLLPKSLYVINLIAYNPTQGFKSSPAEKIKKFKEILSKNKIKVTERYRFGRDIKAACGQLAGRDK